MVSGGTLADSGGGDAGAGGCGLGGSGEGGLLTASIEDSGTGRVSGPFMCGRGGAVSAGGTISGSRDGAGGVALGADGIGAEGVGFGRIGADGVTPTGIVPEGGADGPDATGSAASGPSGGICGVVRRKGRIGGRGASGLRKGGRRDGGLLGVSFGWAMGPGAADSSGNPSDRDATSGGGAKGASSAGGTGRRGGSGNVGERMETGGGTAFTAAACPAGTGGASGIGIGIGKSGSCTEDAGGSVRSTGGSGAGILASPAPSLSRRPSRASTRTISASMRMSFGPPIMIRCSVLSRRTIMSCR